MDIHITDNIRLTTKHKASSHGLPVLLIDGTVYGPSDVTEGRTRASDLVSHWATLAGRTEAEIHAARLFLGQWVDGPQLPYIEEVVG